MEKKLSSTLEDYLEAIFRIEKEKRAARVRDISNYLGVAKSTVNAALKSLASKDLIDYEPYELITLTAKGRKQATDIIINHEIIRDFLQNVLMVGEKRAESVACEMEHAVDREVIERFACFLAFIEHSESGAGSCIDDFRRSISEGAHGKSCKKCITRYIEKLKPIVDFTWQTDE
jgi:DtxR family transcriptional regulator, Mn-dependent transcriptional regulator